MLIDYKTQSLKERYGLMAQSIIPRPIAWIVTQSSAGIVNIAPFSYFTGLSSEPPTVIVSIGHKSDGSPKDTLKNIRETGKCTICMVDEKELTPMHYSSKSLPAEESEADRFEIPTRQIDPGFPPIVEGVPTAFFSTLHQEIDLQGSKTIPIVLEIQKQYINDQTGLTFRPVARIGRAYAFLGTEITPPEIPE